MTILRFLGATAGVGTLAASLAAQTPYPQPSPEQYLQTYPPGYAYPNQNYGTNVIQQVIDQLLGNRYTVTDRTAVSRCASAALAQAQRQYPYGPYGRGYSQPYAYGQGNYAAAMRVTAITEVQRRSGGLRVRGLIESGPYGSPYGGQSYVDPRYARRGDLTFRCDVDYRGYVSKVKISRNNDYRRY